MAMIFGNQNRVGQFHKNCYTVPKLRAILRYLGFEELEISHYRWRGDRDLMIHVKARKPAAKAERASAVEAAGAAQAEDVEGSGA